MALSVTELRKGAVFTEDGAPLLVLEYTHTKVGRGNASVKVKVRNLKTGGVVTKTFISGASVEEAEVNRKDVQYLYSDNESAFFMDPKTFEQTSAPLKVAEEATKFLSEGNKARIIEFRGELLSIEVPLKVELRIAETGPSEKGDTRSSSTKKALLETGYEIQVPMFIKAEDTIRVNTETGKYVERV